MPARPATTKPVYRIRNWSPYNDALVRRGSLTLWVDQDTLQAWRDQGPNQHGAQFEESDPAIQCRLTLRAVSHLTLRAAPPGPRQHRAEGRWRGGGEGPPTRPLAASPWAEASSGRRSADARDPSGDGERTGGGRCRGGRFLAGAGGQSGRGWGGRWGV